MGGSRILRIDNNMKRSIRSVRCDFFKITGLYILLSVDVGAYNIMTTSLREGNLRRGGAGGGWIEVGGGKT
jgi:hypothetical protein